MKMLHFWDNMSRNMQLSKSVRDLRVVSFQDDRPLRKPSRGAKPGGADRDRTDDLRRARAAFSQLNYCPTVNSFVSKEHVRPGVMIRCIVQALCVLSA